MDDVCIGDLGLFREGCLLFLLGYVLFLGNNFICFWWLNLIS